jgi:hypothetical protein
MRTLFYFILVIFISSSAIGQVTLGLEDYEGTAPVMAGTGGTAATGNGLFPNTPKFVSTANGRQINNSSSNIEFATVNATGYGNIDFSVRLASFALTSGNGSDGGDYAIVSISTDGGTTYSQELRINGNSNAKWGFSGTNAGTGAATVAYDGDNTPTVFAPAGGGYRTTDGYSYLSVTNITTSANLRVRIEFLNNSGNEIWVIDDAMLEGIASCTPTVVTSVTPTSGPENTLLSINASGGGLTGSTAITLDGTPMTFTVISDILIEALVPAGANSGNIIITDSQPCDAT